MLCSSIVDPVGKVIVLHFEDRDALFNAVEHEVESLNQPLLTLDDQVELVLDIFGKGADAAGEEFVNLLQELFAHSGPLAHGHDMKRA